MHDAARPLASPELVRAALDTLAAGEDLDAAIAAAPVVDTIKRVERPLGAGDHDAERALGAGRRDDEHSGASTSAPAVEIVTETLDRSALWAVQTPQVFRRGALQRALDVSGEILARATDDAWLVERLGGRVAIVPSSGENLKITTPLDLSLAELLLASA